MKKNEPKTERRTPMQKEKPKWGKPKLIILVRGRPEERVLTYCKLLGSPPTGPGGQLDYSWCEDIPQTCLTCDAHALSGT